MTHHPATAQPVCAGVSRSWGICPWEQENIGCLCVCVVLCYFPPLFLFPTSVIPYPSSFPPLLFPSYPPTQGAGWRDLTKTKYRLTKGDTQLDLTYAMSELSHHVSDQELSEVAFCIYKV